MFTVKDTSTTVGFDSKWKVKKITMQGATQTNAVATKDASDISSTTMDSNMQTDVVQMKPPVYDEQRLANFLKELYPKISKELNEAASSQVFKNYHANGPRSKVMPKLLVSIKLGLECGDFPKSVSSLSWNTTGQKLAVSVVQAHESWCLHHGMIFIHAFSGSDENKEKLLKIKAPSCVTTLSYHPILPPVLAAGTYTGEILIVNTQNEENEQILVQVTGHDAVVTKLEWIDDLDNEKNYLLASGSLDGYVNIWSFHLSKNELILKEKYKIKSPLFGKLQRKAETPDAIAKKINRGIVAFNFSRHHSEKFVIAAEGGLIALCSRLGSKELPETTAAMRVSDPIYKYYRAHEGEITSIMLSPDRPELFASHASDGQIRVYDMAEEEPGNVITVQDETMAVSWVPYSQNLLAACGVSGRVDFYNARNGKLLNADAEKKDAIDDEVCSTCLAFHKGKISVVAVGATDGGVQIWDIPWNNY